MTRKAQLAVSDLMYACSNRDLEEILPEFTQRQRESMQGQTPVCAECRRQLRDAERER